MNIRAILMSLAIFAGTTGVAFAGDIATCKSLSGEYDHFSKLQALYETRYGGYVEIEEPLVHSPETFSELAAYTARRTFIVSLLLANNCSIVDMPKTSATGYSKAAEACHHTAGWNAASWNVDMRKIEGCDIDTWQHD